MQDILQTTSSTETLQPPTKSKRLKRKQLPPKRFKCTFENCSKDFSTSGHLTRHAKIHTGEKTHVCPLLGCDSRFSRKDNMMQHFTAHKKKMVQCDEPLVFKPEEDESAGDPGDFGDEGSAKPEKNVRSTSISSLQGGDETEVVSDKRSRAFTTNSMPNLGKDWKPYFPVTSLSSQAERGKLFPFAPFLSFGAKESQAFTSQVFPSCQSPSASRERMISGASTNESSQDLDSAITDFQTQAQRHANSDVTDHLIAKFNSTSANSFGSANEYSPASNVQNNLQNFASSTQNQNSSQSSFPRYPSSTLPSFITNTQPNFFASSISQNCSVPALSKIYSSAGSAHAQNFVSRNVSSSQFSPSTTSNLPSPSYSAVKNGPSQSQSSSAIQDYSNQNYTATTTSQNYSVPSTSQKFFTSSNSDRNYSTTSQNFSSTATGYPSTSNSNSLYSPSTSGSYSAGAPGSQTYSASGSQSHPTTTHGNQTYSTPGNLTYSAPDDQTFSSSGNQTYSATSSGTQNFPTTTPGNQTYSSTADNPSYSSSALLNYSSSGPTYSPGLSNFPTMPRYTSYSPVEYDSLTFQQVSKSTNYPSDYSTQFPNSDTKFQSVLEDFKSRPFNSGNSSKSAFEP